MRLRRFNPFGGRAIHFYFVVKCIVLNINIFRKRRKKVATFPLAELGFIHKYFFN